MKSVVRDIWIERTRDVLESQDCRILSEWLYLKRLEHIRAAPNNVRFIVESRGGDNSACSEFESILRRALNDSEAESAKLFAANRYIPDDVKIYVFRNQLSLRNVGAFNLLHGLKIDTTGLPLPAHAALLIVGHFAAIVSDLPRFQVRIGGGDGYIFAAPLDKRRAEGQIALARAASFGFAALINPCCNDVRLSTSHVMNDVDLDYILRAHTVEPDQVRPFWDVI